MPVRWIGDPAEFEQRTGLPRVRWLIEIPPARRPTPSQEMQPAEGDKPKRRGLVFPGEPGYDETGGERWGLTIRADDADDDLA